MIAMITPTVMERKVRPNSPRLKWYISPYTRGKDWITALLVLMSVVSIENSPRRSCRRLRILFLR